MGDASAVGMMEGCFFVPRTTLIEWLRDVFEVTISKVEQCASGSLYLQVLDKLYPGKVPMTKVNWGLKFEYEFIKNYKIMQDVFIRCNIKKNIEIEKLTKGKYQDNLEFLQWLKCLYDRNGGGADPYNAVQRRHLGSGIDWSKPLQPPFEWLQPPRASAQMSDARSENNGDLSNAPVDVRPGRTRKTSASAIDTNHDVKPRSATGRLGSAGGPTVNQSVAQMKQMIVKLEAQLKDTRESFEDARDESEFYYSKLRQLELLCTEGKATLPCETVTAILYEEPQKSTEEA